ncbi:hypothetical protein [Actinorugispora endophytica]|uniref:Uncharacterized protein n=1 Tax=Actinorugispora endophytica TaxID=1605990 RepID=A0A4R6V5H4_9ACTN|nr:hypothetical protein [Actinorugispora endophytica]TDQ51434.1 hypothetical protein EV190_11138 [Actinorugispora endophytica]
MRKEEDPGSPPSEPDPTGGAPTGHGMEADPGQAARARTLLAGVLLALFAAMLGHKVLNAGGLEQTALFYVGLPALIALTVVFTARPRSAVGVAMAVTTVGLALAGPLLDEGVVCLVMAAPLFYLVAAAVGAVLGHARGRHALVAAPVLVLLCLEGVAGTSYLPRASEGRAVRFVEDTPAEIAAALAAEPVYPAQDSWFLGLLPQPTGAEGTGLDVGDRREVRFPARRSLGLGAEPTPRSLVLEVARGRADDSGGLVVFTVVSDTTLARWLDLREAEVAWEAVDGGTRIEWTLRYHRTFDPSWYWGPLQGHAVDQAAGYLVDTFTRVPQESA